MKLKQILVLLIFLIPTVLAAIDFDQKITAEEEKQFDEILKPVMKIYNFLKYSATVLGVVALVVSGVYFITSGADQMKKEKARKMAAGVIIGLVVIWVAPLVVKFVFS